MYRGLFKSGDDDDDGGDDNADDDDGDKDDDDAEDAGHSMATHVEVKWGESHKVTSLH